MPRFCCKFVIAEASHVLYLKPILSHGHSLSLFRADVSPEQAVPIGNTTGDMDSDADTAVPQRDTGHDLGEEHRPSSRSWYRKIIVAWSYLDYQVATYRIYLLRYRHSLNHFMEVRALQ